MFEELGELEQSIHQWNVAEIKDALADCIIFCADYCTKRNWDFGKIWPFQNGVTVCASRDIEKNLLKAFKDLAKAAHHQLKTEQGVRGDAEKHEADGARAIQGAIFNLEAIAKHFGWTLMEIATETWAKVKLRDFKLDSVKGGEK
jgi:hypothetical protein